MVSAPVSGKPDWSWQFLLLSRWCRLTRLTSARLPVPHWGPIATIRDAKRKTRPPVVQLHSEDGGRWGRRAARPPVGPCRRLLHEFRDGRRSMQGVPNRKPILRLHYHMEHNCSRKCHLRRLRRGHHRSESAGHPETIRPGLPAESDVYCDGLMRVPTTVRGTASTSR